MFIENILKSLGLKYGQNFTIAGNTYSFSTEGLIASNGDDCKELLSDLITGKVTAVVPALIPDDGTIYYTITRDGKAEQYCCVFDEFDLAQYCLGNFFSTEEQALANKEKILATFEDIKENPEDYFGKI